MRASSPCRIAGARDIECIAEFRNGVLWPHRINQRIPLCGSSESMLTAFFKISRWRRKYSTSRWRRRISPAGSARGATLRLFGSAERACAARPLPRALSRQVRRELGVMPSSSATRLSGRPLLRSRLTASCRKLLSKTRCGCGIVAVLSVSTAPCLSTKSGELYICQTHRTSIISSPPCAASADLLFAKRQLACSMPA